MSPLRRIDWWCNGVFCVRNSHFHTCFVLLLWIGKVLHPRMVFSCFLKGGKLWSFRPSRRKRSFVSPLWSLLNLRKRNVLLSLGYDNFSSSSLFSNPLFYPYLFSSKDHRSSSMKLVELILEWYRIVIHNLSFWVNREKCVSILWFFFSQFSMHIGFRCGKDWELDIMFWDIDFFEKSICLIHIFDSCKLHFCDKTILKSTVDSFYSSLCLRSESENKLYSERITNSSKLSRDIWWFRVIIFVCREAISIDTFWDSMYLYVCVPERENIFNPFIHTETCINNLTRSIIDRNQETPRFFRENIWKPNMIGSIELNHSTIAFFSCSKVKGRIFLFSLSWFPETKFYHNLAYFFRRNWNSMILL